MQYDEIKASEESRIEEVKAYFAPLRTLLNERMIELSDAIQYLAATMPSKYQRDGKITEKSQFFLNLGIESERVSPKVIMLMQSLESDMVLVDSMFQEAALQCAQTWEVRSNKLQSDKKSNLAIKTNYLQTRNVSIFV
jgi:hypothetical protein